MRVVLDVEANGLEDATKVWVVVCKDIDTGKFYIFRNLSDDGHELERFRVFWKSCNLFIGHNILGYDWPILNKLLGIDHPDFVAHCWDTLIVSKMVQYSRPQGHSLEAFGEELGYPKGSIKDFSKFSEEMVSYCQRDVEITHRVFLRFKRQINDPSLYKSFHYEHLFVDKVVNSLEKNGFGFNIPKAEKILNKVSDELKTLDDGILKEFPNRLKLIREVTPRATKHGTISLSSIPKVIRDIEKGDLSAYSPDAPFSFCKWEEFNPSSHKQLIEVLSNAGWSPVDKTETHKDTERVYNRLKHSRNRSPEVDLELQECYSKLQSLSKTGWKINEANLATLPETAPSPARLLAKRILLESRRRTLTEWLGLVNRETSRIHGRFQAIGAWTHRMSHQNPNTANIPNEFDNNGKVKLYGKEMRALWVAPRNRLLVGVDAEGIQLRIFAHYINDPEFTDALVKGKKNDKTDPHSLNQRILGNVCKSRQMAKRFIYALLLGAGIGKLSEILESDKSQTEEALNRLLERYTGFADLKQNIIPKDAERGYFIGLDGRQVRILGDTPGARRHLAMSGYLQNGEAVCMKLATLKWIDKLKDYDALLVDLVHDEWQTECPNNGAIALEIAEMQADSLRIVGEELGLKCPLAGSYWNDDLNDYTVGTNWKVTH